MENTKFNKGNTAVVNIKLSDIPQPVQRGKGNRLGNDVYTQYGSNNTYPAYLLSLYNNSSIHKSIIDGKVNYMLGDGIISKRTGEFTDFDVNGSEDIESLLRKALKDFVIFNYFAIEVVYAKDGSIYELNHLPAQNIRANRDHSKFWYSQDWSNPRVESFDFDRWNRDINESLESKVFFYSGYTPSIHSTYPTPEYSGAIKSIEIDLAIKDFHLNNINNGFSGNTIISFFRGEPAPEIKDDIVNAISNSYTGANGDKVIFQFLEKDEQEPKVTQLSAGDWNEAYLTLRDDTVEDIIIAHGVTSPMLFGIKTEGQLGGATELETSYQIFKRNWVRVKRREVISALNALLEDRWGEIEIKDISSLFPKELSDTLKEKTMTIDEIRAEAGLAPLPDGEGERLTGAPVVVQEEAIQSAESMGFSNLSKEDLENGVNPYKQLSDEEELEFENIGITKEDAVILEKHSFSEDKDSFLNLNFSEDKVEQYLMKNRLTGKSFKTIQSDIASATGERYSMESIKSSYGKLVALRLIPDTKLLSKEVIARIRNGYEGAVDSPNEGLRAVEIRYSYDGPADEKNRAFCGRLVRAGKLYTREDIQKIGALFGYDVFNYKGGHRCRHRWSINTVVRKNN